MLSEHTKEPPPEELNSKNESPGIVMVRALGDSEWIVDGQIVKRENDAQIRCSCREYRRKSPHFATVALMLMRMAELPEV